MVGYQETADGSLVLPPPTPVILCGNINSSGTVTGNSATGTVPVTEASAAGNQLYLGLINTQTHNGIPINETAGGTKLTATYEWVPITPVTITAGVGGDVAATEIVPAGAVGKKQDVMLYFCPNTTGAYHIEIVEATGGALGATVPPIVMDLSLVAGQTYGLPYGFRMMNTTTATNIGHDIGGAATWPNNAMVTFWGFYRSV